MMGAMIYSPEFIHLTIATAGLFALLATAVFGLLVLGYVADEEAKGRRIEWLEEPLAMPAVPAPVKPVELRKAA